MEGLFRMHRNNFHVSEMRRNFNKKRLDSISKVLTEPALICISNRLELQKLKVG